MTLTSQILKSYLLMAKSSKFLVSIVGPTAVGKTDLSIQLAKQFNTEIISADSRQFFREMSTGTAKPSVEELNKVKHHFINSHSIDQEFSAGKFANESQKLLKELFKDRNVVMLVGGSGLYVNALLYGLPEMPNVPGEIRNEVNVELKDKDGMIRLLKELKDTDPEYYSTVDQSNPQRVARAIEVCRSTGKPFSSFRKSEKVKRDFQNVVIGLNRDREELYERINERVDLMMKKGLLEEVKQLVPYKDRQALQTVGYKEIFDFLDGKSSLDESVELIKQNSRRYAKRQLTWFRRKSKDIKWFHPDQIESIRQYVKSKIDQ